MGIRGGSYLLLEGKKKKQVLCESREFNSSETMGWGSVVTL